MVPEKLPSQLVFLIFDLDGLEHSTGFLWLHRLLLCFENNLLLALGICLHPLPEELVLWRLVAHKDLRGRNVTHHVHPLRQLLGLARC